MTVDAIGGVRTASGSVQLASGLPRIELPVTNTSTKPVRVSSHYPFHLVNRRMDFDRDRARGFRLDVPSGDNLRWAPGERRVVRLVAFGASAETRR